MPSPTPPSKFETVETNLVQGLSYALAFGCAVVIGRAVYHRLTQPDNSRPVLAPATTNKLENTLEKLQQAKVIAILRLKNYEKALERVEELVGMGYKALEVTTDSVGYNDGLLKEVVKIVAGRCLVGVGTITTLKQLEIAKQGGADFALSPVNPSHDGFQHFGFAHECHCRGIVAMPAAYTPQEVYECVAQGAKTVKLFPAQKWTPKQLKSLKGVGDFKNIHICPSGGIDHSNAATWLEAGAMAVGMGSCLAGSDIKIADSDSEAFTQAVEAWNSHGKPAAAELAESLGLKEE